MKNKNVKALVIIATFMLLIFAGNLKTENVYAYSYTTVYLEVGERYTQAVTTSNPVFDAYGEADQAVCSATWNSTDTSKRTNFTIKAKSSGSATFYVCKGGKSTTENRVRTVKVYVYNKAATTTLNIINSTSKTNGTYVNMPIYLYNSKTSTCRLTQTNPFPTSVASDTSGKAKAQSTTYASSNTNIATVNSSGVVTAVSQGYATVTAKRSWTTSAGNVKTISKTISVYCKNLPQISVYNGTTAISNLTITTIDKPALTYKLSNMQSTDTIASATCTSADTSKFTVASSNGVYTITPVNVTNGTAVNVIFKIVLNSDVRTHNGDAAATFIKSVPIIINKDANVYVTNVSFKKEDVVVINGSSYKQQAEVVPANATNKKVIYASSNTKVATVDGNGNVNAIGCGTATITATSAQVPGCIGSYTMKVIEKPTEITTIENTGTGLRLEWEEVLNATYQIYRCTEANGSYVKIKTATGTTYTDESGKYGTKYYYKIKAIPKEGETYASDFSNIVFVTKKLEIPKIQSVSEEYGQYLIKLSESVNCDGYIIYNNKKALITTTSKNATVSLSSGTWNLSARAYKTVDGKKIYSDYSVVAVVKVSSSGKVTVTTSYKPAKTKIRKITGKKKSLTITLKKVKNATGYIIKYATKKSFKGAKTMRIKKNSYTLKKLKSKKVYYIKARAYRKVNGKIYYSTYTKVKKRKTK